MTQTTWREGQGLATITHGPSVETPGRVTADNREGPRAETTPRYCPGCGARLHRKRLAAGWEKPAEFRRRRYCGRECVEFPITPAMRRYLAAFDAFLRSRSERDRAAMRFRLLRIGTSVHYERQAA